MAKPLKEYHFAWLSSHPERTTDWLRFMLKAGFDIHHLDGDHGNNDPKNLVLIEHRDHMRLHGASSGFARELEVVKERRKKLFLEEGKLAYETAEAIINAASYVSGVWITAGKQSGLGGRTFRRAELWARTNGLKWPLVNSNIRHQSGMIREIEVSKRRRQERFLSEGKLAYETALVVLQTATFASGIWVETGRKSGLGHKAQCRAELWAKANDLEWPLWRPGTVGWALKQQAKGA